jgi:cytochrome c oxidase assembly factor CtaG/cytochrome c2
MMLLHVGLPVAPHDMWSAWSFEPAVVALVAVGSIMYARGSAEMAKRTRDSQKRNWENASFAAGMTLVIAALISPLHRVGGVLFSAHMIQHELLMTLAAPLLVLGRPAVPMLWALPRFSRHAVGNVVSHSLFRRAWRALSAPFAAWLLHGLMIWIWHSPFLYDASVTSELVHTAQHASFMITALLFWWSLLHDNRAGGRTGLAIIYLFTTALHTSLLGALLSSADTPLYAAYNAAGTAQWGMTPLEDQQLGGIIMWVPGGIPYVLAGLLLSLRWMKASGMRTRERERARGLSAQSAVLRIAPVLLLMILAACSTNNEESAAELTGGNVRRGHDTIRRYGCQSCHSIPGVRGAMALVGPPLSGIADRSYIAGVLTNSPEHMIQWLRNPQAVDDKTAMPNMNVTEKDARDIAAYLYTLR